MSNESRVLRWHSVLSLMALSALFSGCDSPTPQLSRDVGTTLTVELPENEAPVLSNSHAERIKLGMLQDEVVAILQEAAKNTPSQSMIDLLATQGKLNTVRFDVTVIQGKRKLVIAFKDGRLTDLKQEGME